MSSRVRFTNLPHRRKEWKPKVSAAKSILYNTKFQCNLNLGKQAQKTFRCYLILGVQEVVRSTLRSFCTVPKTNESILRILGVTIS